MAVASEFLIYVTLFRLAIITAGIISIVLGYRLFVKGVWPEVSGGQGTDVDARIAGSGLTVRNAAPGTCFALFGVIIIAVMFARGSPQLTLEMLSKAGTVEGEKGNKSVSTRLTLRGGESDSLKALTERGNYHAERNETAEAIAAYREAVTTVATPMNHLAWLYLQQGKIEQAFPLSRLAVQLRPDEANFLDTLAEILFQRGEHAEALKYMGMAAGLDPKFRKKLSKFRNATRGQK